MGNFSRNTFDKLKHYVGVRLQQGVPIVDADWNELEDIRKYELQAFLKWYVGNGVPSGNNGFQILPAVHSIGMPPVIIFTPNDFVIRGGDGTPEGAGRCLVEGQDAIIESNLHYTAQRLFQEAGLDEAWNVAPLPALTTPAANRTDTVYLDVWEREVNSAEDLAQLVNPAIGIETCVRLKREWVVRVAEGAAAPPAPPAGHAHYVLAQLARTAGEARIPSAHIADRRRTGLFVPSYSDISQMTQDAFGPSYSLGHQGQPQLPVSLRDAINAALWGRLPSTPEQLVYQHDGGVDNLNIVPSSSRPLSDAMLVWTSQTPAAKPQVMVANTSLIDGPQAPVRLTGDANAYEGASVALKDGGATWVFWFSDRQNPGGNRWQLFGRRHTVQQGWGAIDGPLGETTQPFINNSSYGGHAQVSVCAYRDSRGIIWLAWVHRDGLLRLRRYSAGAWSAEERVSGASTSGYGSISGENAPKVAEAWGNSVVVYWENVNSSSWPYYKIWYRSYSPATGGGWTPGTPQRLTSDTSYTEELPQTLLDGAGNSWVFWRSFRQSGYASFDYFIYAAKNLSGYSVYDLKTQSNLIKPLSFAGEPSHFSVFATPAYKNQVYQKNYDALNDQWSGLSDLPASTDGSYAASLAAAVGDGAGGAWLACLKSLSGNQTRLVVSKVYGRL